MSTSSRHCGCSVLFWYQESLFIAQYGPKSLALKVEGQKRIIDVMWLTWVCRCVVESTSRRCASSLTAPLTSPWTRSSWRSRWIVLSSQSKIATKRKLAMTGSTVFTHLHLVICYLSRAVITNWNESVMSGQVLIHCRQCPLLLLTVMFMWTFLIVGWYFISIVNHSLMIHSVGPDWLTIAWFEW